MSYSRMLLLSQHHSVLVITLPTPHRLASVCNMNMPCSFGNESTGAQTSACLSSKKALSHSFVQTNFTFLRVNRVSGFAASAN